MNEMNPLEEQLRSWNPRRPSSDVKARLFGKTAPEPCLTDPRVLRWLLPTTACVAAALFFLQTASRHGLLGSVKTGPVPLFAAIGSNAVAASSLEDGLFLASAEENLEWNVWETATFHWTNEHLWTSSMGSLQLAKTNHLQ